MSETKLTASKNGSADTIKDHSRSSEDFKHLILNGPILPVLVKLAAPTALVLSMQALISLIEIYFVSALGAESVAGVTLVFPVQMVMVSMASGGIGGGVASAIAKAVGAGRRDEAGILAAHALYIAIGIGLLISAVNWLWGAELFRMLGGAESVIHEATRYANTLFFGAPFVWLASLLAAAIRAGGNAKLPAAISVRAAFVILLLSPALITGWGPFPRLGVAGAGLGVIIYNALVSIGLIRYMRSDKSTLKLPLHLKVIRLGHFKSILKVGALSVLGTVQANFTVICVTGTVGIFGAHALAGYGIASRIDYILMPLTFSLGTAVLTMVGMNVGAGNLKRARKVAWLGALGAGVFTEMIGVLLALLPHKWIGIFSNDPSVIQIGALYLQTVGPFYGFYGIALVAYFAGQGAGRIAVPVLAGTARLAVAALGGWYVVMQLSGNVTSLFRMVSAGYVVAGIACFCFLASRWEVKR